VRRRSESDTAAANRCGTGNLLVRGGGSGAWVRRRRSSTARVQGSRARLPGGSVRVRRRRGAPAGGGSHVRASAWAKAARTGGLGAEDRVAQGRGTSQRTGGSYRRLQACGGAGGSHADKVLHVAPGAPRCLDSARSLVRARLACAGHTCGQLSSVKRSRGRADCCGTAARGGSCVQ
jgi:hypothetical protein